MRVVAIVCTSLAFLAASQSAETTVPADPFEDALSSAEEAFHQVGQLRDDEIAKNGKDSIRQRVDEVNEKVEATLKSHREKLETAFMNAQTEVNNALASHNTSEAFLGLQGMQAADAHLNALSREWRKQLENGSKVLKKAAREEAQHAETLARAMARTAREKTDSLDNIAREMGRKSPADDLDRAADQASRQMEDAADKASRKVDDKLEKLEEAVDDSFHAEAKARRKIMKKLEKETKEQLSEVAPTTLLATTSPLTFPFWLVVPGFFLFAVAVLRHKFAPTDKNSDYFQIV